MKPLTDGSIRRTIEQNQDAVLSEAAQRADETRGRERGEPEDDLRTCYQLDRDRILYTAAFRRLKFKTQVFIEPVNDDTRTRLTHTLEVMQISRSVARALGLNEDLTEAITLGHDIGHTPFAHTGESVLDEVTDGGFHHSRQSLRVVDHLAREGEGLNLTREVRDGIVRHSNSGAILHEDVTAPEPITREGRIVRLCDTVAYLNHDIEDALKGGYLRPEELPAEPLDVLGEHGGHRIDRSVRDIIVTGRETGEIGMSDEIREATAELRSFMFDNLYREVGEAPVALEARSIFRELYDHLRCNPDVIYRQAPFFRELDSPHPVVDFLSLQSDLTTVQLYRRLIDDSFDHLPSYH